MYSDKAPEVDLFMALSFLFGDLRCGDTLIPTWKYECCKHCAAVGRLLGSQLTSDVIRSMASGDAFETIFDRDVGAKCGNRKFMAWDNFSPSG